MAKTQTTKFEETTAPLAPPPAPVEDTTAELAPTAVEEQDVLLKPALPAGVTKPTVGRIVHLELSKQQAQFITDTRNRKGVAAAGVEEGDLVPVIVVAVFSDTLINGKVMLDGPDDAWLRSIQYGTDRGGWHYPARA